MKQKQKIILAIFLFLGLFSYTFAEVFVSEETSTWLWYSDTCSSAENNHVVVTPTTIPSFWTGDTIYDFEAGTYDLTAGISLTQPCTALIGNNGVLINGNGSNVITISNIYTIIKDIKINGNSADAISFSATNSNTVSNTIIYGSNRWILLTTATNIIIRDTKLFWNTMWISFLTNSNNNILNNVITFNNSQNWIFINWWYRNVINNSISFNNTQDWFNISAWIQNVINNSITYNNNWRWIRFIVAWNYINNNKTFNNSMNNTILANSTWYGISYADVAFPVGLKLWLATDILLWTIWWANGSINTGFIITWTQIFNPHDGTNFLIDTSTATGTWKWVKTFWTTLDLSLSKFWSSLPNQIQPVKWNTANTQLENSDLSFLATKKIGEILSKSGWWSTTKDPVCGDAVVEGSEQCDDGNTWNGDGCTSVCQTEQPGTCGNGILEYMERCDDGNTKDGDSCSATCQIETATIVLTPKQLLEQTALQKTLGVPPALIETNMVETTAEFILSTITQHQQQQTEQCQYTDTNYRSISFKDDSSPYQQQIETLLNYCIVQGKGFWKQRTFWSKDVTTYAEFIKVLVKSHFLGSSVDFHNNTFNIQNVYRDVSTGARYTPYIIKAYVHDLLLPIEKLEGKTMSISPEKIITRLDAIKLLIHTLRLANKDPQNIEIVTDTFKDANQPLTREEMAALMVYWYQLDYNNSLRMRSDNPILIKLLAQHIQKYPQSEQTVMLKNIISKIEKLNEYTLKKFNIYKKELLADLATLIDFSEVFLK